MRTLTLSILLSASVVSATGQIPSTLGWYEIPNTKLRSVAENGAANTQFPSVVAAWSGGVFDTRRNRLVVWGGGHNDYFGNEIYALNLNGVPSVQKLTNACWSSAAFDEVCAGSNPQQPQSRHTYGFISYMVNVDRMWAWSRSWNGWSAGWQFNFADGSWTKNNPATTAAGNMPNANTVFCSAYDPNSSKVFMTDLGSLYTFDSKGVYTKVGSSYGTTHTDNLSMVIDPVGKKVYTFGGGESGVYNINGARPYNRVALATTGGSAIVGGRNPGLAYDSTNRTIVGWAGGDTVYSLNLTTFIWTPITYAGGPGSAQTNGTFGRWQYAAALGVFVLVNSVDQNAYSFRLNGQARVY